ncbi:MAG: HEAT repeat domain-containing protein, partial [Candidatus Omnitrophica bacterium]|nr:HEAT repeat domain-containing protein [Candidatus Omnitrophota bacterium]
KEAAIKALTAKAADANEKDSVRLSSIKTLGEIKDAGVAGTLLIFLNNAKEKEPLRAAAAEGLGKLNYKDNPQEKEAAIKALTAKAADANETRPARLSSIKTLGDIKDASATETLLTLFENPEENSFIRLAAAQGLGGLKYADNEEGKAKKNQTIEALIAQADEKLEPIYNAIIKSLEALGASITQKTRAHLNGLKSENEQVRVASIEGLLKLGYSDDIDAKNKAIEALRIAANDKTKLVRDAAKKALGILTKPAEPKPSEGENPEKDKASSPIMDTSRLEAAVATRLAIKELQLNSQQVYSPAENNLKPIQELASQQQSQAPPIKRRFSALITILSFLPFISGCRIEPGDIESGTIGITFGVLILAHFVIRGIIRHISGESDVDIFIGILSLLFGMTPRQEKRRREKIKKIEIEEENRILEGIRPLITPLIYALQEKRMSTQVMVNQVIPALRKVLDERVPQQDQYWQMIADLGVGLVNHHIGPCDTLDVGVVNSVIRYPRNLNRLGDVLGMLEAAALEWHKRYESIRWSSSDSYHVAYREFVKELVLPLIEISLTIDDFSAYCIEIFEHISIDEIHDTIIRYEPDEKATIIGYFCPETGGPTSGGGIPEYEIISKE